jgi:hypothetical protein
MGSKLSTYWIYIELTDEEYEENPENGQNIIIRILNGVEMEFESAMRFATNMRDKFPKASIRVMGEGESPFGDPYSGISIP